nr:hypothetical protein [Candidatus Bathyarchaeota archaeon]
MKQHILTKVKGKWDAQPPKEKIWWVRNITAMLSSIASTIIKPILFPPLLDIMLSSPSSTIAALTGVTLILIVPAILSRYYLKITQEQIGGWMPYFTAGLITSLFLWLTLWTTAYTLLST